MHDDILDADVASAGDLARGLAALTALLTTPCLAGTQTLLFEQTNTGVTEFIDGAPLGSCNLGTSCSATSESGDGADVPSPVPQSFNIFSAPPRPGRLSPPSR